MKKIIATPCPCGSGKPYRDCCGPCHDGSRPAPDAEALMRSRYAAYVLGDADYLLATWHPRTRPPRLDLDEEPVPRWLGLAVKGHLGLGPEEARVEFVARYKIDGRAHRLHETSRFLKKNGRWYYVDGDLHEG
ncbi:MAG: SEC-C domain-containing protein [Thiobacillus sp.]|nr:SEC-C domain-containing protein [Thiobacillus sp.]